MIHCHPQVKFSEANWNPQSTWTIVPVVKCDDTLKVKDDLNSPVNSTSNFCLLNLSSHTEEKTNCKTTKAAKTKRHFILHKAIAFLSKAELLLHSWALPVPVKVTSSVASLVAWQMVSRVKLRLHSTRTGLKGATTNCNWICSSRGPPFWPVDCGRKS